MRHLSCLCAFVTLLSVSPASAGPDKHSAGKLSWALHVVASEAERGPLRAQGRRYVDPVSQRVTAVAELAEGYDADDLRPLVTREGGRVEAVAARLGWVKLSLPASALRRVAATDAVRRLRRPFYPLAMAVESEGAALIHAQEFIARTGANGTGVTVAVLDAGYQGLEERLGSELPEDTEISDFVRDHLGSFDSPHGTACAEVVHDVAPGAHLLILGAEDDVSYVDALQTIFDRRIPIVSHSMGWPNLYPTDGKSPISQNVDILARRGVLFVTAAGNEAESYYRGAYRDADANGMLEFSERTELLPVGAIAGKSSVVLRWDDSYGSASHDYDLYIVTQEFAQNPAFEDGNPAILASSRDLQAGNGDPLEIADLEVAEDQVVYAVIRRDPASTAKTDQKFSLWAQGGVHPDFRAGAGSIALPADAAGALAVAAVNQALGVEGFSSRGPTDDGRVKPDLGAPDGVSTESYGAGGFFGTSAATPHVAGAAALLLSRSPGDSLGVLRGKLEKATTSGGDAAAKNNDVGFGVLDLNRAQ